MTDGKTEDPAPGDRGDNASKGHEATRSAPGQEELTVDLPEGAAPDMTRLPESVGGYRVLGVLGEGGMGIVYEAEQANPRRRVALKVIRGGQFVDESRVKMFQREAETLARLKHPNIGAIYESGRTDDGQHFFAMELVRGTTLDAYISQRPAQTTPDEIEHRLALHRKICDAVHYAHQRGVIHRDLKPSNIVVTEEGSESAFSSSVTGDAALPTVKILDFGLARITEEDVAATQLTEVGVIKGTLPYMAPEQARGDAEAIDIRTDVYALGVVLYEMLTGRRPYDAQWSALLDAVRVICEEPPMPLSRVWTGTRRLDPDVETVVGMALEKEPDRRYQSAAALSEDIGRFLASQPILARPPSAAYQLRKLMARHRTAFAASLALAVVLVVASVVSTSLYFKARRETARARVEASKSDQVATFMAEMLEGVGPEVAQGRDTTMLREILDQTAGRIGSDLESQPEVEGSVRNVIGNTYRQLGELELAEDQLRAAVVLHREALGDEHPETLTSINNLGLALQNRGSYEESEALYAEALAGRRQLLGPEDAETLVSINNYGILLYETGRYAEAEPLIREAVDGFRRVRGPEHPQTLTALTNLALLLHATGRYSEAESAYREALEAKRRVAGDDHPDTLRTVNSLAVTLERQGRYDEAEAMYLETTERHRRVVGDDHPDTMASIANLGTLYTTLGRFEQAEPYLREALERRRRVLGNDHLETLISINSMSYWYFGQRRLDEAETMVRELVDRGGRLLGPDHPDYLVWVFNMGQLLERRGRSAEAEPYFRETLESRRRVLGAGHPETLVAQWNLAANLEDLGRLEEAETLFVSALAAARADHGGAHASTQEARGRLARFYLAHDRPEEARPVVAARLAAMRRIAESSAEAAPKNAYAWEALSCEPAELRDPEAALDFALEAVELGDWQDPDVLDTLALAHHRSNDTARAVEIQRQALDLIDEGDADRRRAFEATLAEYERALAEHESSG